MFIYLLILVSICICQNDIIPEPSLFVNNETIPQPSPFVNNGTIPEPFLIIDNETIPEPSINIKNETVPEPFTNNTIIPESNVKNNCSFSLDGIPSAITDLFCGSVKNGYSLILTIFLVILLILHF